MAVLHCAQTAAAGAVTVLELDGKDSYVELPGKLFTNDVVTVKAGWSGVLLATTHAFSNLPMPRS